MRLIRFVLASGFPIRPLVSWVGVGACLIWPAKENFYFFNFYEWATTKNNFFRSLPAKK